MFKKNESALKIKGSYEWLLMRVTALIICAYLLYLLIFLSKGGITYEDWYSFFSLSITKIFTSFSIFAIVLHAWIGMWQVITDYIQSVLLQVIIQILWFIVLIMLLFWVIFLMWNV
ncbi:succinate dehydrogenase, hydrophobic membrane anchor protein [Candidatus Schneideria nysicola]|uniref:succinate dehydrogenase, hydrophobic membrane anchor protein n=1 Tax=Candidatus Schneideria nysicola TaxID=1081631 RepID=UPI001CAA7229|nr:succinate dehydrogenase, hydrophobic membrane anchor protein [Candidatus Schneideria nysicola]UAJ66151.1 succinate dehydrogenase, hydrophobic membrane anchor protein [Candidatus Schneideria nysicola]